MTDEEAFQRLCQAQIEGTATNAGHEELAALLARSDSARRCYVDQMRIHAMLTWQHGRAQAAFAPTSPRASGVRWTPRRVLAMAAAFVFFAGLAAWWQMKGSRGGVGFEVLVATDVSYRAGDRVERRLVEMDRGFLSIRLSSGAMVEVMGPAAMELLSPMHVRLLRGDLTADVGKAANGFIVDTKDARVVDLGTRFGVSADPSTSTDVAVFEGKVEIYRPAATQPHEPEATLIEGDAVRIGSKRTLTRLKVVALRPDARSLDSRRASDVVSTVTDNVADPSFRGYYGLVRGGMSEGAGVYTTGHTRTWHPLRGEGFPHELAGADVIRTFSMDRYAADLQIVLQISQPCDLYVMLDARAPAPEWVRKDFVMTGYRLRSGPWIPRDTPRDQEALFYQNEKAYYTFAVWKRHVAASGEVTLGSPLNSESLRDKPFMYGLAVKRVP